MRSISTIFVFNIGAKGYGNFIYYCYFALPFFHVRRILVINEIYVYSLKFEICQTENLKLITYKAPFYIEKFIYYFLHETRIFNCFLL